MDLQRLRTFRTVATLMNFNRAASVLNYSQSAVSTQIKTLENEIGALLFKRIGKSIQLTAAGVKMLVYADRLLAIEEEARAEIGGQKTASGLLTIRMPQTLATHYLPQILRDFCPRFPGWRLDVTSCAQHMLAHEMKIGTVDLAFLFADGIGAKELESELLGVAPLAVVANPDHAMAAYDQVSFKDLEGRVLILPKNDCGYRMIFEETLALQRVTPAAVIEMNCIEAIKRTLIAGIGVGLLPEIAVRREMAEKRIAGLAWSECLETGILMIQHRGKRCSPALEAFMEAARHQVGI
jgi:DNA-binding transcriptional LysR family regulator